MHYLEKVGMAPYVNAKPRQLSGGQKPVSYTHLDVYKRQGNLPSNRIMADEKTILSYKGQIGRAHV